MYKYKNCIYILYLAFLLTSRSMEREQEEFYECESWSEAKNIKKRIFFTLPSTCYNNDFILTSQSLLSLPKRTRDNILYFCVSSDGEESSKRFKELIELINSNNEYQLGELLKNTNLNKQKKDRSSGNKKKEFFAATFIPGKDVINKVGDFFETGTQAFKSTQNAIKVVEELVNNIPEIVSKETDKVFTTKQAIENLLRTLNSMLNSMLKKIKDLNVPIHQMCIMAISLILIIKLIKNLIDYYSELDSKNKEVVHKKATEDFKKRLEIDNNKLNWEDFEQTPQLKLERLKYIEDILKKKEVLAKDFPFSDLMESSRYRKIFNEYYFDYKVKHKIGILFSIKTDAKILFFLLPLFFITKYHTQIVYGVLYYYLKYFNLENSYQKYKEGLDEYYKKYKFSYVLVDKRVLYPSPYFLFFISILCYKIIQNYLKTKDFSKCNIASLYDDFKNVVCEKKIYYICLFSLPLGVDLILNKLNTFLKDKYYENNKNLLKDGLKIYK